MANPYFVSAPLTVYDGDIAKAADLNNMGVSVETAFDLTDQILQTVTIDAAALVAQATADVALTHADVVLTNADVALTHADVALTHADVAATALNKIATGADVILTHADVVLTNADVISSAASALAAATSYDNFDDRYLGSKSADPTLDNDGNALLTGSLYWNTAANELRIYTGTTWINPTASAVVGPASAIDGEPALFDTTSGKLIKGGGLDYVATVTHAATSKTTPVDADEFGGADSAASFGLKKYSWANIKATLFSSPSLTGIPSVSTAVDGTNTTQIASTEFVQNVIIGRNRIINGRCQIDQEHGGAAQTITSGAALAFTIDRFYAYCTGANVVGQQITADGRSTYRFTGAASNAGVGWGQRIAADNSYDLAGGTASFQIALASSSLASITWTAYYANSKDAFGTLASPTKTQIATGTFTINSTEAVYKAEGISIPAAAFTGIEVVFTGGALLATETLTYGDFQFEPGSVAHDLEAPDITKTMDDCLIHLWVMTESVGQARTAGTGYMPALSFPKKMFSAPTMSGASFTVDSGSAGTPGIFVSAAAPHTANSCFIINSAANWSVGANIKLSATFRAEIP